jgi:integrase
MIDDLRVRNRSVRTINTYIAHIANFARHFGKSPELLGPEEIRQYQVYLVHERHVSWSNFNQAVCALRFLYRHTLGRDFVVAHIPCPRLPKRLPVVLSQPEVLRFFAAIRSLKYRAILMTAYAAGLRLGEITHLRPGDIDSERMVIRVQPGQRTERPLRDALPQAPGGAPPLLARRETNHLAFPGPATEPADHAPCGPVCLSPGRSGRRHHQTRNSPHPAPLLRYASVGSWH